jgi:hypothetical protein
VDITSRGKTVLDAGAKLQVELCARRVRVPHWKTRLGVVGKHVMGDIMTAIGRVPQPRAELKVLEAIDLPEHVRDLKCVILWGDRSKTTGQVGMEIRQIPMNNRLSKDGKIVWDPRTRNKNLFLPADDLRRQDLEIHVHGMYYDDENPRVSGQPVCLGYVQLNGDTPLLQPRQGHDREGNESKEVLYFPLVHSVEHATSGVMRVMQGQLGIQIRPVEIPNEVNKQLRHPNPQLKLLIHDATNIARAVPFGLSNPYVRNVSKIELRPNLNTSSLSLRSRRYCKIFWGGELVAKTLVEHSTLSPVWREEQFIMPLPFDPNYLKMTGKIEQVYMLDIELRVEVWSKVKRKNAPKNPDDDADDKFLGQVTLKGKDLRRMPMYYFPHDLRPRSESSDPREMVFVQGSLGLGLELMDMECEMPEVWNDEEVVEGGVAKKQSFIGGTTIPELLAGAKLVLHVIEGWGMACADWGGGASDPMCKIFWAGKEVGRTKAIDDTLEPVWDEESFDLIYGEVGSNPTLDIEVYDMDITGPGDFLGMVSLYGKDLLNPPQDKNLVNCHGLPGKNVEKLGLGGRIYELQKKPGKTPKYNKFVQGHIMLLFDESDALSRKKAKHDAVKLSRLAEAQKEAMGAALKHSYRMAKKHMKKKYEQMMQNEQGRNDQIAWTLYRAMRKEYERAKQELHDHQFKTGADFHSDKAVDPEEAARIEKEFAQKRAIAKRLADKGKRKQEMSLSDKLAQVGADSGMVVGPGGEVHHKKKKKKHEEGEETDFEASLLLQAAWEKEQEGVEREEMFTEDPLCHSWLGAEAEERRLMLAEGVDEDGFPKDAPEWDDPEPEDFDPPVLPDWNADWKVEQRMVPLLPVTRQVLYVRLIDCRGLEFKGLGTFVRVWWCGKEVGRTDGSLLAEHAMATGKEKAFGTDPIFQYEEPFLLPMPAKAEDAHLSCEVWSGPGSCRGQVTLEGKDLLRQAYKKEDERDKCRVPFQLFPLRRTMLQKAEDTVRNFVGKAR